MANSIAMHTTFYHSRAALLNGVCPAEAELDN